MAAPDGAVSNSVAMKAAFAQVSKARRQVSIVDREIVIHLLSRIDQIIRGEGPSVRDTPCASGASETLDDVHGQEKVKA